MAEEPPITFTEPVVAVGSLAFFAGLLLFTWIALSAMRKPMRQA